MGIILSRAPHRDTLFWVFCRIIAQDTRLILLRELLLNKGTSVSKLAKTTNLTESTISSHLKLLHTAGLVIPYRRKQLVLYAPEAPAEARFSIQILPFLIKKLEKSPDYDQIVRLATAFTHQRRVELIRLLKNGPKDAAWLMNKASMTPSAFYRQAQKLKARGFVIQSGAEYTMSCPQDPLGSALLKAALF